MARTLYPRPGRVSGQNSLLHTPQWNSSGLGLPGVIVCHGLDAQAKQAAQGQSFGNHPAFWADRGMAVLAVDLDSPDSWSSSPVMTILDNAYADLMAVTGGTPGTTKTRMAAWSCGGSNALNWIKRNPTLVERAWLWNPLVDLDWANATGGYTPTYATGGVTPGGGWSAEIAVMLPSGLAGWKVFDEPATWRGLGIPIRVAQASDDALLPPLAAPAWVTAVNDPLVTLRTPQLTGGHGNLASIPTAETEAFLRGWT